MFGSRKKADPVANGANGKGETLNVQPIAETAPQAPTSSQNTGETSTKLDPEMLEKIAAVRTKLHETFGKVALAMMMVPRYRSLSISDLGHLILDPLMRDRVAIATSGKEGDPQEGALSGIAIWASVSEEVDAKIREQIKAGIFPVRLKAEDWNSGKINWLLDVIAPNQRLTTAVIANFRQVLPKVSEVKGVKEGDMRIHPIVTRLVDPDALKKMGATPITKGADQTTVV